MITLAIRYWYFIVIAVLVAMLGAQEMRVNHAQAARAQERQAFADERTRAAQAAQKAEQEARIEEQRRADAARKVVQDAQAQTAAAKADAVAAGAAAVGLRERIAALVAAARSRPKDSAPASGSETAADPVGVLALVLGRADERAGILAEYADAARVAGNACSAAYDSLN